MIYKVLFFIWFGLIVFFSVVPNSAGDQSFLAKMSLTQSGFFLHVFGYFVLSALAFFAFEKKRFWLYLVGIVLVGVLFEGVQYVMPTRTFNWYDVVANGVGILAFVFIMLKRGKVRKLERVNVETLKRGKVKTCEREERGNE